MQEVLYTLSPVFLIIATGACLRKFNFFTDNAIEQLKRLAYWVGLPSYLFIELSEGYKLTESAVDMLTIFMIATVCTIILLYIIAKVLKIETWRIGTFVQLGFRGNFAYVGLPVVYFAYLNGGACSAEAHSAQKLAALGLGAAVVVYNILAVTFLLASRHGLSAKALPRIFKNILTNPLLVSSALGIAWSLTGVDVPRPFPQTFRLLGKLALPVALLCVGGSLISTPIKGNILAPTITSIVKTFICPAIGFLTAICLGTENQGAKIAVILLATPTSVGSFVLTSQLKGDSHLASAGIVLSTLLSLVSLGLAVALV